MSLRLLFRGCKKSKQIAAFRIANPFVFSTRGYASGEQQDLVVIGGGPGGYVAAIKAAQLGMKVTCVEGRGRLGGTCLNVGCIPSKALLKSSEIYEEATKHAEKHGVIIEGARIDLEKMMKQKDNAVDGLTKGIEFLFKKNKVTYKKGWGGFNGNGAEVEVKLADGGSETLSAKNVIIATGSEVSPLKGIEIDEDRIVSSTGALELKEIPKSLVVIGGGYIGLEMGSVWSRLGSQVTVVEFLDRIVPAMLLETTGAFQKGGAVQEDSQRNLVLQDGEVRKAFQRSLQKQGLKFKLGYKVQSAKSDGKTVKLELETAKDGKKESIEADIVLVSAGRKPFLGHGLGLDKVGVELDDRGRIVVDKHFKSKSSSGNIFAIGDVIPGPMLAHKAEEDGVACVELLAGKAGHVNYDTVPGIVYTHPEVASVGLTEEQAKEKGLNYKVSFWGASPALKVANGTRAAMRRLLRLQTGKFPFVANSRAKTVDDAEGLVKFVADAETDKILGAHIMGPAAGELIQECVLGMEYGASTEDIARTCHGHPTFSEAVKEAAMATSSSAIHA